MEYSLGTFGDLRFDKGGARSSNRWPRARRCASKRLGGGRKGEQRAGRFFASRKVTAAKIIASWSTLTGAACAGRHALAIDDTCEAMFATTAERRRGLGPVKKGNTYGLLVHSMIAVDAASGACLGLVGSWRRLTDVSFLCTRDRNAWGERRPG